MMNKHKIELLKTLCTLSQQSLHDFLYEFLLDYYPEESIQEMDGSYIYVVGNVPICLTAHLDTVHKVQPQLESVYCDTERGVMWSPAGIGGDDRCGVFIIMNILFHGYKPHILFTWNEEIGGVGAREAATRLNPDINFVIQFDRRGHKESVYYNLENKEFEDYINSFGFKTEIGTYTDICELCPEWGCAGVNLSAGYRAEHTKQEMIFLEAVQYTTDRACEILDNQIQDPVKFIYTEKKGTRYPTATSYKSSYYDDYYEYEYLGNSSYICHGCQKPQPWYTMDDRGLCHNCEDKTEFYKTVLKEMM